MEKSSNVETSKVSKNHQNASKCKLSFFDMRLTSQTKWAVDCVDSDYTHRKQSSETDEQIDIGDIDNTLWVAGWDMLLCW